MTALSEKDATLGAAVQALRANRPLQAEEICRDYLVLNPGSAQHLRLLGHALLKQNRLAEAEEKIRFALSLLPDMPLLYEDLGSVLAMQERYEEAVPQFEQAIRLEPQLPMAHKKLGQALAALGRGEDADEAYREYLDLDPDKGVVASGINHLKAGRKVEAIDSFRAALKKNPDNVDAMRFLATAYWQDKENLDDTEALLRRATQIAPDYIAACMLLGTVLLERNKFAEAVRVFRDATAQAPQQGEVWAGLGNALARASEPHESARAFARAIELEPGSAGAQMGYAHTLKTLGDQPAALDAYRAAIRAKPDFGEVYWSMANLKVFRFEDDEISAMEKQVGREDLSESAAIHFRFALGKAHEDKGDFDRAWHYYHTGNQRQRMQVKHDPLEMEERQRRIMDVFNAEFIAGNADCGCDAPDPIFIVGLPRSGSTLVEQILASHSQVEGTAELPILGKIASSMGRYRSDRVEYPEIVKTFRKKDWRAYGEQYMEESRHYRSTDKPYFTDKLPNNFPHVGLAQLILPHAKIINARRHPLDSCLGAYKQLFAKGQHFTYDIQDLSEYYQQYHKVMTHWHAVLPGKVLDVHYEDTVTRLEWQVRRLLEHCGLPFEEQCLRFHETDRPVKTASSEQVRQPIYRSALGKWRHYETHLDIWREDLAGIIDELPDSVKAADA
ncbi:MAG TPA: sulfotransferase [Woeseiaceae bacterium]|nr:sulfotransferase [Woeseiaceae bacterium]